MACVVLLSAAIAMAAPGASRWLTLALLYVRGPAAGLASDGTCDNATPECVGWAEAGECKNNPMYMMSACRRACGACDPKCVNRDKSGACEQWAQAGECENNPAFMKMRCAFSCGTCDLLDYKKRCPIDPDRKEAVPPGKMKETFERALSNFPELEPQLISAEPWIVTFDNFLSADEIAAILHHGEGRYVRSTASGGRSDDEFIPLTSEIRTSWCGPRRLRLGRTSVTHRSRIGHASVTHRSRIGCISSTTGAYQPRPSVGLPAQRM